MQIGQNMFFSYSSNEIAKWDLQTRKKVAKASTDAQVLKMKLRYNGLLTCQNKKGNFIIMYDNDLNLMFQTCINFQPQNIKKFLFRHHIVNSLDYPIIRDLMIVQEKYATYFYF